MRRLLLIVAALLAPATARADGADGRTPPTFYFSGCSNPITGCVEGIIRPFPRAEYGYLYNFGATCANSCVPWQLLLYDSQANLIYAFVNGDHPGGNPINGEPAFGILTFGAQGGQTALAITTTPEPISMALVGTGLALLGVARRRRAKLGSGTSMTSLRPLP